jgi:hypothetical protein
MKSLIIYASISGNTEKVAKRFEQVFMEKGWECDLLKVTRKSNVYQKIFDCDQYDFICVGSFIHKSLPADHVVECLRANPANLHYSPNMEEMEKRPPRDDEQMAKFLAMDINPHKQSLKDGRTDPPRIIFGPPDKKGVVFVTFAGEHQGYEEAVPALALLKSELEHTMFQCMGTFACPGRFGTTRGWFRDLPERPNEKDLIKADIFLAEILDEIAWVYSREK